MKRAWVRMGIVGGALVVGLLPPSMAAAQEEECKKMIEETEKLLSLGTPLGTDIFCDLLP
ncbi:MAG: hypothetical protein M3O70_29275 [Actinomycetota bacterium]|nr:hypothetical protein [Actinomycetota bacterium]